MDALPVGDKFCILWVIITKFIIFIVVEKAVFPITIRIFGLSKAHFGFYSCSLQVTVYLNVWSGSFIRNFRRLEFESKNMSVFSLFRRLLTEISDGKWNDEIMIEKGGM